MTSMTYMNSTGLVSLAEFITFLRLTTHLRLFVQARIFA
jgi:hypothetical protein